jgi:hypothetical protein
MTYHAAQVSDVWMCILDLILTSEDMKACNVVCASWHTYLQPRLFSCVCWLGNPITTDDIQTLHKISRYVRRLCVHDRQRLSMIPCTSLPATVQNWNITELELRSIRFEVFADLQACLSSLRSTLSSVLLINCEVNDYNRILLDLESSGKPAGVNSYPVGRSPPSLRELSMDWISSDNALSTLILNWIVLGSASAFRTLQKLRVTLMCANHGCMVSLSRFLSHPFCYVQVLQIVFSDHGASWDWGRTYLSTIYRLSFELHFSCQFLQIQIQKAPYRWPPFASLS